MTYKSDQIGVALGIPLHKLMEFKNSSYPLSAIANFWLCGNVEGAEISWRAVATALDSNCVGEPGLARNIREKYCQSGDTVDKRKGMEELELFGV